MVLYAFLPHCRHQSTYWRFQIFLFCFTSFDFSTSYLILFSFTTFQVFTFYIVLLNFLVNLYALTALCMYWQGVNHHMQLFSKTRERLLPSTPKSMPCRVTSMTLKFMPFRMTSVTCHKWYNEKHIWSYFQLNTDKTADSNVVLAVAQINKVYKIHRTNI